MKAFWNPEGLFGGKSNAQLETMSKWFGSSAKHGYLGKTSLEVNIGGVKGNFNFGRFSPIKNGII